jgi:hypothetical protein
MASALVAKLPEGCWKSYEVLYNRLCCSKQMCRPDALLNNVTSLEAVSFFYKALNNLANYEYLIGNFWREIFRTYKIDNKRCDAYVDFNTGELFVKEV